MTFWVAFVHLLILPLRALSLQTTANPSSSCSFVRRESLEPFDNVQYEVVVVEQNVDAQSMIAEANGDSLVG